MWWRFRKHKMALICSGVLIFLYFVAIFCEFVAPYDPDEAMLQFKQVPPTAIHIRDAEGQFHWPVCLSAQRARWIPRRSRSPTSRIRASGIRSSSLFTAFEYKLLGLWKTDIHLFGLPPAAKDKQGVFLLGTDRLGRDMFSRVCYGARLSLSMGLVSVFLSLVLGRRPGRHLGLLRRDGRYHHPARDRVHPHHPHHPALDDAERGAAAATGPSSGSTLASR